jgi:glucose/arabinose dehydrogenase
MVIALVAGACERGSASPTPLPGATSNPASPPAAGSGAPGSAGPEPSAAIASPAPDLSRLAITLEPFATVAGGPLAMTAPDDGTGRLFVAAQEGQIWLVEADGSVGAEPMADLGPRLTSGGERGLLGLAAHPTFPTDPRIFVNYTNQAGDTIVASIALAGDDPDRFDTDTQRELLFQEQPYPNHNGGGVVFGPDGFLYLSLGDGGSGGDPQGNGQRLDTLLGKILRVDVDHASDASTGGYVTPSTNPFAGGGGLPEIWHWGLRNPWRLSFDRASGDMWIGDVGQNAFEEIDVARSGASGLNFGWNVMEGSHCFNAERCSTDGLTLPVTDYGRDLGCTVIGGYVYRGSAYPLLAGTYLFADYCSGRIFALDAASDALVAPVEVGTGGGQISAFGEDTDGELYVLNLGGVISKVVATER